MKFRAERDVLVSALDAIDSTGTDLVRFNVEGDTLTLVGVGGYRVGMLASVGHITVGGEVDGSSAAFAPHPVIVALRYFGAMIWMEADSRQLLVGSADSDHVIRLGWSET